MRDADTAYLAERTHSSVGNDLLTTAVSPLQMGGSTPRLRQQAGCYGLVYGEGSRQGLD
jgi:hypothetical protein